MGVLLQISDTHFGTEQPPVVEALLRLVTETRPEVIVWSGDITQRARRGQFDAARAFLEQLRPATIVTLPGNHDIPLFNLPARLLSPYAGYRRVFGDVLEPRYESADFHILCVNTTRWYRHIDGEISMDQVQRIAEQLDASERDRIRIVVTHQPVHVIKGKDEKNVVRGNEQAVRRWAAAGADIVMGGHIHLPYVRPLAERFPDLPRAVWAVQAGTALSWRVRHSAPNSVNLLRRANEPGLACIAERWDFSAAAARFEPVNTEHLMLDRSRREAEELTARTRPGQAGRKLIN